MPLDFDPIYHTETMVRILWDQGSTLHAMELAEKILEGDPDNEAVRGILEELKKEARASFDRFRKGAKNQGIPNPMPENAPPAAPSLPPEEETLAPLESQESAPEAKPKEAPSEIPSPQARKVHVLENLLTSVQNYRRQHG